MTPNHVAGRMVNDHHEPTELDHFTNGEILDLLADVAGYVANDARALASDEPTNRRYAYRCLASNVQTLVALRRYIGFHGINGPDEIN